MMHVKCIAWDCGRCLCDLEMQDQEDGVLTASCVFAQLRMMRTNRIAAMPFVSIELKQSVKGLQTLECVQFTGCLNMSFHVGHNTVTKPM